MNTKQLEQRLCERKHELGLVSSRLNLVEVDEADHDVAAGINPKGWDIEISVKKGFNPIQDRRTKAYARKKKIENGLETLLDGLIVHEVGHWELSRGTEKGCPFDTHNHDKILEAIKEALPDSKKSMASYVANMFEDIIDNAGGKELQGNLNGLALFWYNEGVRYKTQANQKNILKKAFDKIKGKSNNKYDPLYEAFVKLNMHLAGDNVDRALVKEFYSNGKVVDDVVKKVVDELSLPANIQDTAELFDKDRWAYMARLFTKAILPLIKDQPPQQKLSAYQKPEKGEGSPKEEEEEQQGYPGNGIEDKTQTQEGKEEVAYGRFKAKEGKSSNLTEFEQLDAVYKRLARAIPVKVETMSREQALAIGTINYKLFDPETDDPRRINPNKLVLEGRELGFAHPNMPLVIPSRSKVQRKSFPDFKMVMIDTSGSMTDGLNGSKGDTSFIPWGDKSKYHYALLGLYGIENFLQRQGIAQYIKHGLSLFSNSTSYAEGGFNDLQKIRKQALNPQFGGTSLDTSVLKQALSGKESFVVSISDGEIANWVSERDDFKKLMEQSQYGHIQIGRGNEFTSDLEAWGKPVFYVKTGEELSRMMVDLAKKTYNRYVKQ